MKQEDLVQRIAALLRKQFRASDSSEEMRCIIAAEKIVNTVILPAMEEHERQINYLFTARKSIFDS